MVFLSGLLFSLSYLFLYLLIDNMFVYAKFHGYSDIISKTNILKIFQIRKGKDFNLNVIQDKRTKQT